MNTRHAGLFVSLVLSAVLSDVRRACAEDLGLEDALNLLEGSLQTIKSYDVRLAVTTRLFIISEPAKTDGKRRPTQPPQIKSRKILPNEQPKITKEFFRQVLRGDKGRIEFMQNLDAKPWHYIVYDSEIEKIWTPKQLTAAIGRPSAMALPDGTDYRQTNSVLYFRAPLLRCLREPRNAELKRRGAGDRLVIFEAAPTDSPSVSFGKWGFRVTVDPGRGFMPVEFESTTYARGKLFVDSRRRITEWKEVTKGMWVPTQMVTEHYRADPKDKELFGTLNDETVMQVETDRSSWNGEIPAETFELPLPAGATVVDDLRSVVYVTGKPDLGQNLDELAANATQIVKATRVFPEERSSKAWRALATIGGVAIVAIALFVFLTARRRKRVIYRADM